MQYYVNGFKPGDPEDAGASEGAPATPTLVDLPDKVDVLIVGCGPAGLLLAAQLARFPEITTRIIEQKAGPLLMGQADGVSGRSLEIFQALGVADRVLREAYYLEAITFWTSDSEHPENIARRTKKIDGRGAFSEFPHVVLNQARVHQFLLDAMRRSPARIEPDYCRRLANIDISTSREQSHPVAVTVERIDPAHEGQTETLAARYVVGCDGARSTVRQQIGLELRGDSANKAWGVMDLLLVTDFPDIRIKSVIQSQTEGAILIIPREGGHLVRLYVEMDKLKDSERVSRMNITVDKLIAAAARIFHPYSLDVKEVVWWSVYEIGQRVCDRFANVSSEDRESASPNVFIVGDACHTHSPKAGQGMNVSMHDSFNLGWKLASVLRGQSSPTLLHSYESERRAIAQELIDFDRELSTMFSVQGRDAPSEQSDAAEATQLEKYMIRHDRYVSGTQTEYAPSMIVGDTRHQALAHGFRIGTRLDSEPVVRLSDARPVQLRHVLLADGRWRILAFSNREHPATAESPIQRLADFLQNADESPLNRYRAAGQDIDAVIELLVVFQQDYRDIEVSELPDLLWPAKGVYGLRDFEKLYCPDFNRDVDIFDEKQIDRDHGCLVVVRPDHHVAAVFPLHGFGELVDFFERFMLPQN